MIMMKRSADFRSSILLTLKRFNSTTTKVKNNNNEKEKITYGYTLNRVKTFDYENYLSSLLISNLQLRRQAIALRAFNIELAQIADVTSNQVAATGRLEFWQGIINLLYDEKESHTKNAYISSNPVILELYSVSSTFVMLLF